ncbi:AmmeMemoRadiSam system radical SAM enzyme [Candidatus Bipolaricaulota bacterium]|nr:AmmeMemoRadiSam system radical SAM enzyme [Candidatus Bipolaricaulota bacterium]
MKEAFLYSRLADGRVRCALCEHRCMIPDGARGRCGVRENRHGTLYSLVYGRLVAQSVDPIEKKPLFHFLPGTRSYSIATVGCNFTCQFCQNHEISQWPRGRAIDLEATAFRDAVGKEATPAGIVEAAIETGCESIAYTYNEPTVSLEFVLDVAREAHSAGLRNILVSNGFMTPKAIDLAAPWIDGINIDLKAVSNDFYRHVVGGDVRPVLHAIEQFRDEGVWVEVTTLVIPGHNDADDQLRWTAEAIAGISPSIPWHVSRFFPSYRMHHLPATPCETMERALAIGRDVGLKYVYVGNLPGGYENTHCPGCGTLLLRRHGFVLEESAMVDGACPECGIELDGVWFAAKNIGEADL